MYLNEEHDLKFNKSRAVLSLLPSIERLDLITTRLLAAGFILLTSGLALAPLLMKEQFGVFYQKDAKILWSFFVWILYVLFSSPVGGSLNEDGNLPGELSAVSLSFCSHSGVLICFPKFIIPNLLMPVVVIGLSHHSAPVTVREKFAFTEAEIPSTLRKARELGLASESVILSTCNRVELYAVMPKPRALARINKVLSFLQKERDSTETQLSDLYFTRNLSVWNICLKSLAGSIPWFWAKPKFLGS